VVYEAWDQVRRVVVVQEKCLAALNAFDEHVDAYGVVLEGVDDEDGDGVMVIVQEEGAELVVAGVVEAVFVVIVVVAVVAVAAAAVVGKMMGEVLW